MNKFWILVASHVKARVLAQQGNEKLSELKTFVFPDARKPERDLLTDAPGRSYDRLGQGRHAIEPHTKVRRQLAQRFAHELAGVLEEGRVHRDYDKLILVAPADFIGVLKAGLSKGCLHAVIGETHKNIVGRDIPTIVESLPVDVQLALKRGFM